MGNGAVNVLDHVAEDYMVLANYIQPFPVSKTTGIPTISAESGYSDVTGRGWIAIVTKWLNRITQPLRCLINDKVDG